MFSLPWVPLGLIGILSWSVWFIAWTLSRHAYSQIVNDFRATTSLVVPVYREDADVLERCLRSWLAEKPTEIILVVDDRDDLLLARLRRLDLPTVRVLPWRHTGKRGALGAGVRAATGEIVVFSDSDTSWRLGLLAALQMPFADPRVGGVGSRQHVHLPRSDVRRRVAYWLLNTRYLDYVPAMSGRGGVACLSGRTAAYRRGVITPLMPAQSSTRGSSAASVSPVMTPADLLVLAAGYRTVHQASAQADSMFPDSWAAFVKQRVRWSRNSYRAYLTALAQGWLWRQPLITQVTVLQVLVTPLSMGAAVYYTAAWASRRCDGGRDRALPGRCWPGGCAACPTCGEPPRCRDHPADGASRRRYRAAHQGVGSGHDESEGWLTEPTPTASRARARSSSPRIPRPTPPRQRCAMSAEPRNVRAVLAANGCWSRWLSQCWCPLPRRGGADLQPAGAGADGHGAAAPVAAAATGQRGVDAARSQRGRDAGRPQAGSTPAARTRTHRRHRSGAATDADPGPPQDRLLACRAAHARAGRLADVDGAVLLKAHLEVPVGATLVIDGQTPDLRLTSGSSVISPP